MTHCLMYHDVVARDRAETSGFPTPAAAPYKVEPIAFRAHLDWFARRSVEIDVFGKEGRWPSCALTFDDGGSSAMSTAAELEQHGLKGHFLVTTSLLGRRGFLTTSQVRELATRGHIVGSHSHTHPTCMAECSQSELEWEWSVSADLLEDVLGERPWLASVSGECVSRRVYAAAERAGYRLLLTSRPTSRVRHNGDLAVAGRYVIWRDTSAAAAVRYAVGDRRLRLVHAARWGAKRTGQHAIGFASYRALASKLRKGSPGVGGSGA